MLRHSCPLLVGVALLVATGPATAQKKTRVITISEVTIVGRVQKPTFQHIGILSLEFHVDKLSRPLL